MERPSDEWMGWQDPLPSPAADRVPLPGLGHRAECSEALLSAALIFPSRKRADVFGGGWGVARPWTQASLGAVSGRGDGVQEKPGRAQGA